MNPHREQFLNLKDKPARLNVEEAAWYLGFATHDIPILISNGLLKPLGHPADNATKYFAFDIVEQHRHDAKWLARATDTMMDRGNSRTLAQRKTRNNFSSQSGAGDRTDSVRMQRA